MKKILKKFNKIAIISFSIAVISVIVGLGVNIVFAAWSSPSQTPPGGDIAAPINISDADQYKDGKLRIGSVGSPGGYTLYVDGDSFVNGNVISGGSAFSLGKEGEIPWQSLWVATDSDSGTLVEGIHFAEPTIGIRYDISSDQFDFYKDGNILSIGDKGDVNAAGGITAMGGMNIDSNTLVVDNTNNRIGIGTSTPSHSLDIESGDAVIENGRLLIGDASFPNTEATLYVGTKSTPVLTLGAIQAYSNNSTPSALATIYAENMGSNWKAAVQGVGISGHGVKGYTYTGSRVGVYGTNNAYSLNTYNASAVKGKNAYIFGSNTYGDASNNAVTTGVEGRGASTNRSLGYIDSYGVLAIAGIASADSALESINTYGLYAVEGLEEFGGVSYAGYFEGDVHITGDLTMDDGVNVGIGTTNLTEALRVKGNIRVDSEGSSAAYIQLDSNTGSPTNSDCDEAEEVGRMSLATLSNRLYICDDDGWRYVILN